MAILARATITLAQTVDIDSVTWYYKLQASTASAPAKPTTATPSGWSTTEPTYTEGSTNSLYVCQKTTYSDGTFEYSEVIPGHLFLLTLDLSFPVEMVLSRF